MIHNTLSPAMGAALKVASKFGGAAVKQVGDDAVLIPAQGISVSVVSDMFLQNICYL
jgi:hypothetical protein